MKLRNVKTTFKTCPVRKFCTREWSPIRCSKSPISFVSKNDMGNFNNEGFAIAPQAECVNGKKPAYWADDDLFYGHVLGFKGLERPAVVLAVNGFRDEERAREMLYVGLSRARDLLVVCGDLELIRRVGGDGVAHRLTREHVVAAAR